MLRAGGGIHTLVHQGSPLYEERAPSLSLAATPLRQRQEGEGGTPPEPSPSRHRHRSLVFKALSTKERVTRLLLDASANTHHRQTLLMKVLKQN